MLEVISQRKIKKNWEKYKEIIRIACTSSEGARVFTDNGSESFMKEIYGRLMNPFNQAMHLWSEGNEDYILLTHIEVFNITGLKVLTLYSYTRVNEIDKETLAQRWFEAYKSVASFAKDSGCAGMLCYSDLEYFAEMAKKTQEWSKVNTRYQFYFPL